MTNEPASEAHPDKVWIIYAVCNKRFTSMRAISMHLKMTATRHVVNFINYGGYDKKTGLREMNSNQICKEQKLVLSRCLESSVNFS
jgi:hypothetical protein